MALALHVDWTLPVYEAAAADRTRGEWPPEVVRPFGGMLAMADTEAERDALRWLERQRPPLIWCSRDVLAPAVPRRAYVVTNAIDTKDSHQRYVARSAGRDVRTWARVFPARPEAWFVWPEARADGAVLAALAALARRVPYVGRATSPAVVDIADVAPTHAELDGLACYAPVTRGEAARHRLRVPYAGYVDALLAAHDAGQPAWQASTHTHGYRLGERQEDEDPVTGPFADLVVFGFPAGVSLVGMHAAAVGAALRNAVRSRAEEDLPAIHGHHAGGVRQCAFLALPHVGGAHGDGRLLGVAVALPAGLDAPDRAVILRALHGDQSRPGKDKGMRQLAIPGIGRLEVRPASLSEDGRRGRWTLHSERWTQASRTWVSALPVVPDRFPRKPADFPRAIADTCEIAGYPRPDPDAVEVSHQPFVSGGVTLHPRHTVRRRGETRRLPNRHVRLTFPEAVRGPVVLGNMRFYGLGLCVPAEGEGH